MSKTEFAIKFETENAAFEGDDRNEVATILRRIARYVEEGWSEGRVLDTNGNAVGRWEWK